MRFKEVHAKDVPSMAESAQRWMEDKSKDGASWMMGYFYGTTMVEGDKQPDELSERIARAQAKRCAASLDVADCYSVTGHKTLDIIEAAWHMPADMEVRREYFDTDNGFMVFEKGYYAVMQDVEDKYQARTFGNDNVRIMALSWRIFGRKMHIYGWTDTHEYLHNVRNASKNERKIPDKELMDRINAIGPLIICGEHVCDLDTYMRKAKAIQDRYGRDAMTILLAACLMLRQNVTAKSIINAPRGMYRFGQRLDMNEHRAVTIIDKRSIKPNPTNEELPENTGRRQLSVRYDVRGHWRVYKDQRFSPELRENPIWIPYHWVGDESLPMVDRKKVTRLKR